MANRVGKVKNGSDAMTRVYSRVVVVVGTEATSHVAASGRDLQVALRSDRGRGRSGNAKIQMKKRANRDSRTKSQKSTSGGSSTWR